MEKSPFRMEISPFYFFKWRNFSEFFSKKLPNASEKHLNGEISIQNGDSFILNGENPLLSFFLRKVQNAAEKKVNGENLHSEWRFLHSEWRKLSVEFVFQKKSSKRF